MTKPITFLMLTGIGLLLTVLIAHAADNGVDVRVRNNLESPVNVFLKTGNGETAYGTIPVGGSRVQGSRPGDVWVFKSGSVNDSYSATDASDQSYEVGARDTITRHFLNDTDQPLTVYEGGEELATIRGEGTVSLDLSPGTGLRFVHPDDLAAEHIASVEGESYLTVGTDEDAEIVLAAVSNNVSRSTRNLTHPEDMPERMRTEATEEEKSPTDPEEDELGEKLKKLPHLVYEKFDQRKLKDDEIPKDEKNSTERLGDMECTVEWFEIGPAYSEQLALDPAPGIIYPGAMVYAETLKSGEYRPVPAKRNPITLSTTLDLENRVIDIERPENASEVRQKLSDLMDQEVRSAPPAQVTGQNQSVTSKEDLTFKLGGTFNSSFASFDGGFNFNQNSIKTRKLLKFTQVYYSVDMDTGGINSPSDFFVDPNDLARLEPKYMPAYVASVKYGRQAYLIITSEYSEREVTAALRARFNGASNAKLIDDEEDDDEEEKEDDDDDVDESDNVEKDEKDDAGNDEEEDGPAFSGAIATKAEWKKVLENTDIQFTIVGGDGMPSSGMIRGDIEKFMAYVEDGGRYSEDSPGIPIAWKLNYLDHSVAYLCKAFKYPIRNCDAVGSDARRFSVTLKSMTCTGEDDPSEYGKGTEEFYGTVTVTPFGDDGKDLPATTLWNVAAANAGYWAVAEEKQIGATTTIEFDNPKSRSSGFRLSADIREWDLHSHWDEVPATPISLTIADAIKTPLQTLYAESGGTKLSIQFEIMPVIDLGSDAIK
ncbi:Pneumolysin [Rubripirellula tenax]|uniref:Pneumolysin n=1 Tax=Rubripirellula tenax TaxID=2528015 RepID=A0A5C6EQL3_9BACT|nr:thiol-activated cytolysin family protein [Rubripirellula tenax]TWU50664.1 Pneumolysin [Rubripirellula tenax]